MNIQVDKNQKNKTQEIAGSLSKSQSSSESTFQLVDNRSESIAQRKLQAMANNSLQAKKAVQFKAMIENSATSKIVQKKENKTGLPENLKSGIENLSGYSMDDVKVYYNSPKPAQLQAHAYAQGTDIYVASGQEKHIPHEVWHVVQQKQGRVKPTMQTQGKVNINDDAGLEKEATIKGAEALQKTTIQNYSKNVSASSQNTKVQQAQKNRATNSGNTVQRTMNHVNLLIDKYDDLIGVDRTGRGPYADWPAVQADQHRFSNGQWIKIQKALEYNADGTPPDYVDRSGNQVADAITGAPGVDDTVTKIEAKMNALQASAPVHFAILNLVEDEIIAKLGLGSNLEFWKGAHIVFNDQGAMYQRLKVMGDPIASKKADGSIKNKTEFAGLTSTNYFGIGSSTKDQREGKMMERRPGTKETGHYSETVGGPPQYGIDLPAAVKGHLLFGLTAEGDTFVQTEGAGFQSFWEGTIAHGAGALTVRGYTWGSKRGMQTGMVGNSMHSEDPTVRTEIREHDNPHWNEFFNSIN